MIYSIIHNIPTAIVNSILLMAILWIMYQYTIYQFKWNATKRYQIASTALLIGTVFFLLELASISIFNIIQLLHFSFFSNTEYFPITPNSLYIVIGSIYFVLLLCYLLKFIVQFSKLNTLKENSDFSNSNNYKLIIQDKVGFISNKIKIGTNETITSPMVFGIIDTIILLPASLCTHLTSAQLKFILLHELAHILNNDFIINLLIEFASILLWFNPFVMLFKKEIQLQREIACDEFVISKMNEPLYYSKTLLQIATHSISPKIGLSLAAITGKNDLNIRIQLMNGLKKQSIHKLGLLLSILILPAFFLLGKVVIPNPIQIPSYVTFNNFASISANKKLINNKITDTKMESKLLISNKKLIKNPLHTNSNTKSSTNNLFASNNKNRLIDSTIQLNNISEELTYNDLLKQTRDWIKARENNITYANYNELNNAMVSTEITDEALANKLLVISIVKNYQLKKTLLAQKVKKAVDTNEARDFILNSEEWNEMVQYEKWVQEFLNRQ